MICRFSDNFAIGEMAIRRTHLISQRIERRVPKPIQAFLRHPWAHLGITDEKMNVTVNDGLVEPATCPWVAYVVLVKRKMDNIGL